MGFFDTVKKGASLVQSGIDKADELTKKKMARMSDSELLAAIDKNPNNKYAREELRKRGL